MKITDGWRHTIINPVTHKRNNGTDMDICDAARVSFSKEASQFTDDKNSRLLHYLADHNHWSPFAHVGMTLHFHAPMFIARQFQKHVVGFAWNEVSRRYVDNPPTFWVPESFRKRPDNMKQGSVHEDAIPVDGLVFDDVRERYVDAALDYKAMIEKGVCPEQARAFLPQATMTEWIWTGSLQAWYRFVDLRGDDHAQSECWEYANAVQKIMMHHFPMASSALFGFDSKETLP